MSFFGDFADRIIDIFRNTRTADIFMYIGSVAAAFFRGKSE